MKTEAMKEKTMDCNQSVELIVKMIDAANRRLERSAGRPFLIWGYVSALTMAVTWVLQTFTQNALWGWFALAIPVVGFLLSWLLRLPKESHTKTHLDRLAGYVWIVFGIAYVCIIAYSILFRMQNIHFYTVLLLGAGMALTGLIMRFGLLVGAGVVGMLFSLLGGTVRGYDADLFYTAAFVILLIIPGHVLNHKSKKQCLKG